MPRLAIGLLGAGALAAAIACGSGAGGDDALPPPARGGGGVDGSVAAFDAGRDASVEDAGLPPIGDCPMGPAPGLPAASPRILVIAPASANPQSLVRHLQGLLSADPAFTAPEVVLQLSDTSTDYASVSLLGFWYSPGGRAARLAPLAGPFDWVVMLDDPRIALTYPELHFEGVRAVACRARAAGARPILLQTWTSDASDTAARGTVAYRVGNGTGTPVVPAGYAWESAQLGDAGAQVPKAAPEPQPPIAPPGVPQVPVMPPSPGGLFVAAASVYTAITGKSAATTSYLSTDIDAATEASLATAAAQAVAAHATTIHYTTPFASAVERRTLPQESDLWFMSSGTSSEALWFDRMNDIVPKLARTPRGTALGSCNDTKTFDATCLTKAQGSFAAAQYRILFARDYSVSSPSIAAAGMQKDLQAQIWDRHYDQDPADGAATVAALETSSAHVLSRARAQGLAWIPYHLMFAKLKTARPSVQLTSDGTHATYPVGYGLAAMSVESRTSRVVPTTGLDADTAAAVLFADETIRQLAALSQWGTFVDDDPATRPRVR